MARSRARWSVPTALGLVLVLAGTALAAISWESPTAEHPMVSKKWSWNYGSSLGMTDDGKLHMTFTTDKVGSEWVSDSGPMQAVYYRRGTVDGSNDVSWSKPKKVSSSKKHFDRSSNTAESEWVYVGMVTHKSYDSYDSAQPRTFYFRSNSNYGAGDSWNPLVKMSPGTGRVDYPVIAAAGDNVYAIWTNSDKGKMVFKRSTDNGATWTSANLGTVTKLDSDDAAEGYAGWPGICADGNLVGAAWIKSPTGNIVARISTDGGATFGAVTEIEDANGHLDSSWPQCTAYDGATDRVAFATTNRDKVFLHAFTDSATSFTTYTVYDYDGATYNGGYGPAPEFNGTGSRIGVGFTGCKPTSATPDCDYFDKFARVDLLWTEAATSDLSTWTSAQLLATKSTTRKNANLNDYPSVVWYDADTRFVTYNSWTPTWFRYQVDLQTGDGTA